MIPFLARHERFDRVGSTNDVVRDWLAAGTPEVCLAVAREQTAGRGRDGRRWVAPPGAALLLSLGFRPAWLAPDAAWRLAAVVSLAMAEAAEAEAGLSAGTVRLKWPNDLVIASDATGATGAAGAVGAVGAVELRKLAGVLGETDGLGSDDPRVVVGLGLNADWAAADFPPELAGTMTSLREAARRRIDLDALLDRFLARLEPRIEALRTGIFDGAGWADRQLTTGRTVRLGTPAGDETVGALGVDAATGALVVADASSATGERHVLVGEITHVRLAEPIAEAV
jgi:BirA family transcriptional regulator, biotin operon repressor / biotin---[acetyl-CoA-carboxylase] ligase